MNDKEQLPFVFEIMVLLRVACGSQVSRTSLRADEISFTMIIPAAQIGSEEILETSAKLEDEDFQLVGEAFVGSEDGGRLCVEIEGGSYSDG